MSHILLIGLGGFLGSILRYLCSEFIQGLLKSMAFPFGTMVVNLTGCLLIGFLSQLAQSQGTLTAEIRAFLFIGLLGGFTTFSTFGNETMHLFRESQNALAFVNVTVHLVLGLGAVWLGRILACSIWH